MSHNCEECRLHRRTPKGFWICRAQGLIPRPTVLAHRPQTCPLEDKEAAIWEVMDIFRKREARQKVTIDKLSARLRKARAKIKELKEVVK